LRRCKVLIVLGLFFVDGVQLSAAQQAKKPLTAALETELWSFNPERFDGSSVHFSPDRKYFVVYCERGRLDINRPEDSFRFYLAADIENFLKQPGQSRQPAPIWVLNLSEVKEGPNIEAVSYRWLDDSTGVAFLQKFNESSQRLVIADLKSRRLLPLTSQNEDVQFFDIRNRNHYVYTAASTEPEQERAKADNQSIIVSATGRTIGELMIPDDPAVKELMSHREYHLWAVIGNERFAVKHNGAPFDPGDLFLALSPDGLSLVTTLPVEDVPKAWETLYPPPTDSVFRIRAGNGTARRYVLIDLRVGSVRPLLDAPRGNEAGWFAYGNPAWSDDGKTVLLPNTFLEAKNNNPSRPCVAVVDLAAHTPTCVESLKERSEEGFHMIWAVDYTADGQRVVVTFGDVVPQGSTQYRRSPDGLWQIERQRKGIAAFGNEGLEVIVAQGINDPPLLEATEGERSKIIWDPNPQLKSLELSLARTYTWKDKDGRAVEGGLYPPVNYKPGQRYPLVIQTHGFAGTSLFLPSGTGFPNEFAARQLATAGFFVLQADDLAHGCTHGNSEGEGPCAASNYETAAKQLVADGLVDPDKIGLIGFSRSCFYVMEALTRTSYPFKAALIGSGVVYDYMQFLLHPDPLKKESEVGGAPFGNGMHKWLELSPGFNLDKIGTPLAVIGHGPTDLLDMWGVYAGLHALARPVDLVMLRNDEHVITNPATRVASQTLSVDWFRFWLQGYEDPDPAKAGQYKRWRELRKLQAENDNKSARPEATSN
jgi:dipeptidyl aminopeptidase/acylaminoacyl peptidase